MRKTQGFHLFKIQIVNYVTGRILVCMVFSLVFVYKMNHDECVYDSQE